MGHPTTPWAAGRAFCLLGHQGTVLIRARAPGWHCPSRSGLAAPTSRARLATAHAGTPFPSMKEQTCLCVREG